MGRNGRGSVKGVPATTMLEANASVEDLSASARLQHVEGRGQVRTEECAHLKRGHRQMAPRISTDSVHPVVPVRDAVHCVDQLAVVGAIPPSLCRFTAEEIRINPKDR